jgi:hypothetical protein
MPYVSGGGTGIVIIRVCIIGGRFLAGPPAAPTTRNRYLFLVSLIYFVAFLYKMG